MSLGTDTLSWLASLRLGTPRVAALASPRVKRPTLQQNRDSVEGHSQDGARQERLVLDHGEPSPRDVQLRLRLANPQADADDRQEPRQALGLSGQREGLLWIRVGPGNHTLDAPQEVPELDLRDLGLSLRQLALEGVEASEAEGHLGEHDRGQA